MKIWCIEKISDWVPGLLGEFCVFRCCVLTFLKSLPPIHPSVCPSPMPYVRYGGDTDVENAIGEASQVHK